MRSRRLDKMSVSKHLDIYLSLAGLFENGVRVLLGLKMCLDGLPPEYAKLGRRTLRHNIELPEKWPEAATKVESANLVKTVRHS